MFGFDPRLQYLHEEDAVAVFERMVLESHPGTFNVAGSGIVVLSQAVSVMGKVNLPVIPFIGSELAMTALDRAVSIGFSPHLTRLLRYGRVVDTSALSERLGDVVRHTTLDTVLAHARTRRVRGLVDRSNDYEYEGRTGRLPAFAQGLGFERSCAIGSGASRSATRAAAPLEH